MYQAVHWEAPIMKGEKGTARGGAPLGNGDTPTKAAAAKHLTTKKEPNGSESHARVGFSFLFGLNCLLLLLLLA